MQRRVMVQETLTGVDVREREVAPVDLPPIDLTKYAPGMSVRKSRPLIRCPECGKTGEAQGERFYKREDKLLRPVAHLFVQSESDNYVPRAMCLADPDAVKKAIKDANAIVAGG